MPKQATDGLTPAQRKVIADIDKLAKRRVKAAEMMPTPTETGKLIIRATDSGLRIGEVAERLGISRQAAHANRRAAEEAA